MNSFNEVLAITTELFGEVAMSHDWDPEFADEQYVVFAVAVKGDLDAIVELEHEWVRRVQSVSRNWLGFRLSIRL